ncbi:formate dehydrogenase subunit gamma [Chloroflexota bacterium]
MTHHEVEKYRKSTRVLHWIHTGAFILLFLTGLVLFVPQLGILAQDSWTRIIHRIAAVLFTVIPLIYLIVKPKASWQGIKDAFIWGSSDMGWLKAAPRYYFLGDDKGMPPQGHMNTGQKMWWFMVLVFGVLFVISGLIMWFAKTTAAPALLQWMVLLHDVSFIVTGTMLFVHIYLGVIHPLMTESWKAITGGKISTEYAKSHHGKWYEEVAGTKEETS